MGGRRKLSKRTRLAAWLRSHRRVSWALLFVFILLAYLPLHAYHGYADARKFHQARAAIDDVYADISLRLGQPANLKSRNICNHTSTGLHGFTQCIVETDFVYPAINQNHADVLLGNIQAVIARHKAFRPTRKLSAKLSDRLVFETVYHDALDNYSGPHHIACSVKYSFDTPDEIDLSTDQPHAKAFEVFFACSSPVSRAVYPLLPEQQDQAR